MNNEVNFEVRYSLHFSLFAAVNIQYSSPPRLGDHLPFLVQQRVAVARSAEPVIVGAVTYFIIQHSRGSQYSRGIQKCPRTLPSATISTIASQDVN